MTQRRQCAGAGAISVVDRAPHPNAAKLYLNWLLSREGQAAWRETKFASLRVDVPKTNLIAAPEPGKAYANAGNEAYGGVLAGLGQMVTDILAKSATHA